MSTHFLLLMPLWPPSMYLCFKKDLMKFAPYLLRMSINWFLPCFYLKNFLSHTWQHWARMTRQWHIKLLYSPGQLLVALRYLESSNFVHVWPHSMNKILWLMPALEAAKLFQLLSACFLTTQQTNLYLLPYHLSNSFRSHKLALHTGCKKG